MILNNEQNAKNRPIGIYDSGVGGLSVLHVITSLLPNENFIYYGDLKNAPYGTKSQEKIMELSLKCGEFLYNKNVKSIIIACNTATGVVVQTMRDKYNIPIFSMEPAVKPAIEQFKKGQILVLATPATLALKRYESLLVKLGAQNRVINIACPEIVEFVEQDKVDSEEMDNYLKNLIVPLGIGKNICAVILGCTHFSFAQMAIEKALKLYLKDECKIFDGRFGTARYVRDYLMVNDLLIEHDKKGSIEFYSSLNENGDKSLMNFFYNHNLPNEE